MKYTGNNLRNILESTLKFKGYDLSNIGRIVEMEAIDAFTYSIFTNSGYLKLDEPEKRLLIKKDFFRVYNQAEQYELQFGLFKYDSLVLSQSPVKYFEMYPWLISSKKYVVFLEYSTTSKNNEPPYYKKLYELNKKITLQGMEPHDFVITLVNSDRAMELESFFEYLVSEKYKKEGFFTDNQLPFYYGIGTPDIAAFSISELSDLTYSYFGIKSCSFIELSYLKHLSTSSCKNNSNTDKDVVFEVKTSSIDGSQIKKYIDKNIFDEAYEVIPQKSEKSTYSGLINIKKGVLNIDKLNLELNIENKNNYKIWLLNYVKVLILANLNDADLAEFLRENIIDTQSKLICSIEKTGLDDLFEKVFRKGNKHV